MRTRRFVYSVSNFKTTCAMGTSSTISQSPHMCCIDQSVPAQISLYIRVYLFATGPLRTALICGISSVSFSLQVPFLNSTIVAGSHFHSRHQRNVRGVTGKIMALDMVININGAKTYSLAFISEKRRAIARITYSRPTTYEYSTYISRIHFLNTHTCSPIRHCIQRHQTGFRGVVRDQYREKQMTNVDYPDFYPWHEVA